MEAALAVPRERDSPAVVDGALDEEELARELRAGAVDRAGADEGRGQRALEQRLLELGLLRRVRGVTGLRGPLGLEDRHGQPRRLAALPVERPAFVVGVDRARRDDDERADETLQAIELLAVLAMHGDGVEHEVGAIADDGTQLRVVLPVGHDRLDAALREPCGQRARARHRHDLPAVRRQRTRRGAADHPRAPDQHRPRH